MPNIRSSADLRNKYNEISDFCHTYSEPIFITKNGKGDLVVLSIEAYEKICGKFELYSLLNKGLEAESNNEIYDFDDAIADIGKGI